MYAVQAKATIVPIPTKKPVVAVLEPIPSDIQAYIFQESKDYGIDPEKTAFIVSHESQWNQNKIGDDGICNAPRSPNYGKETSSRGLWQINSCWHAEISDQCAFNIQCSTRFSLALIAAGGIDQWSTIRLCQKLYGYCPK